MSPLRVAVCTSKTLLGLKKSIGNERRPAAAEIFADTLQQTLPSDAADFTPSSSPSLEAPPPTSHYPAPLRPCTVHTDAHLAAPCCPTRPAATFPLIDKTHLYMRWFLYPQGGDETSGQQILRVTREVVRVGTSAWPRLETRAHARRQTAGAPSPYCLGHRRGISSVRLYDAWV